MSEHTYSEEELVGQLRTVYNTSGELPNDAVIFEVRDKIPEIAHPSTFYRRIGSTAVLHELLGVESPHKHKGNRYKDEEIVSAFSSWVNARQDYPNYSDYKEAMIGNDSLPTPAVLIKRFGGYNELLRKIGAMERFSIQDLDKYSDKGSLVLPEDMFMSRRRRELSRHLNSFNFARAMVELSEHSNYGGQWLPMRSQNGHPNYMRVETYDSVMFATSSAQPQADPHSTRYSLQLPLTRYKNNQMKNRVFISDERPIRVFARDKQGDVHRIEGTSLEIDEIELVNIVAQHTAADFADTVRLRTN